MRSIFAFGRKKCKVRSGHGATMSEEALASNSALAVVLRILGYFFDIPVLRLTENLFKGEISTKVP